MNLGAPALNYHQKLICQMNKMKKMKGFLQTVFNLIANKVHTLVKKIKRQTVPPKGMLVSISRSLVLKVQSLPFHKSFRYLINLLATNRSLVNELKTIQFKKPRNNRRCLSWSNLKQAQSFKVKTITHQGFQTEEKQHSMIEHHLFCFLNPYSNDLQLNRTIVRAKIKVVLHFLCNNSNYQAAKPMQMS